MFLSPIDIHGCILFNFIVIIKIRTNDSHLWSCVYCYCYQFLALFTISDLFRVITFASVINFTVCAICCNFDSQITPTTEDFQASTNLDGLPRGIEDKAVVNHCGFGSYKTKLVKSSINHLPLCPKAWFPLSLVSIKPGFH